MTDSRVEWRISDNSFLLLSAGGSTLPGLLQLPACLGVQVKWRKIDKALTLAATWRSLSLAQSQIGLLSLSLPRSLAPRLGRGCRINRRADVSSLSSSGKGSGTDCDSLAPTHAASRWRSWVDRWAARRPLCSVAGLDGRTSLTFISRSTHNLMRLHSTDSEK